MLDPFFALVKILPDMFISFVIRFDKHSNVYRQQQRNHNACEKVEVVDPRMKRTHRIINIRRRYYQRLRISNVHGDQHTARANQATEK
jgi:hypothetical protein